MMGDNFERPEGSDKEPMNPDATFMQVISNLVINQQAMTHSSTQMIERLATGSTPGTQAPHAVQGNSRAGSRPCYPLS
jgi:hypothetical protein